MKPGTWDIVLVPDTPKVIRDVLQPFGHIVIFEAQVDPRIMADADLLKAALYVGPLRRKPTPYSLAGAGMAIWLGDEEGKGQMPTAPGVWTLTNGTFIQWVQQFLVTTVFQGTLTAVAGTLTYNFSRLSARTCLDFVCGYFTGLGGAVAEYRVNNDAGLDAGPSPSLFNTAPGAIVMPREGSREGVSGLVGIDPTSFAVEIDADSYTTQVFLVGATGTGIANVSPATTYKDLRGNIVQLQRVVSDSLATAGLENARAAALLPTYGLRQVITLTTDRYDIPHDVRAGDWIYVYDPEHDLVDLTNPQNYRGQIVWPIKLRVFAITWPVESGMAVFYRDGAGAYTDLTPWVQFEQPGTTFEVGAPSRTLTF